LRKYRIVLCECVCVKQELAYAAAWRALEAGGTQRWLYLLQVMGLRYAALCCATAPFCATLHSTALQCAVLHCAVLHCAVLQCAVLHCPMSCGGA
jgi:hypothetical protein